jgi:hypothetical protein
MESAAFRQQRTAYLGEAEQKALRRPGLLARLKQLLYRWPK